MIDLFLAFLNGVSLIDPEHPSAGRFSRLARVLSIVCAIPAFVVVLILLIVWISDMGPTAQKIAMGVGAMQLAGLLVLLMRKRDASDS
ncbi:hypothetical protein CU666_14645 [Pseudomonas syringae pv. actinidifoliorum]|nr:hypothetical protein [Pseudomonas syringae pv. actinidifoliorum]NAT59345.1 hypothetical protein [Pseudomonas syringae pv. actinidifoliorum]